MAAPEGEDVCAMTEQEIDEFLSESQYAAVTSLRKDGSPLTVPLGYEWDGKSIFMSVRSSRMIVKRLARDPRVCFTVWRPGFPVKDLVIEGIAEPFEDPGYVRTRRMFMRYMSEEKALRLDEFWQGYIAAGRAAYQVRPLRIVAVDKGKESLDELIRLGGAGTHDARARARGDLKAGEGR